MTRKTYARLSESIISEIERDRLEAMIPELEQDIRNPKISAFNGMTARIALDNIKAEMQRRGRLK